MVSLRSRPLRWTLFFGLCASALLFNAGGRPLSEPDELRYLEVAREMEERGSWVLPLYNYELYLEKGPLFFYLLAGAQRLTGDPFRAALLPSQVFSFLSLLAAFALFGLWGWSDRRTALSLAMLTASALFFLPARYCRMDAVLAFFVLSGYWALFQRLERGARWAPAAFGLATGLALLTKGPVALLWLWLVPLAWSAWNRDRRAAACLFHPFSLLAALFPVLAWLLPAWGRLGGGLWDAIFIHQTGERLLYARTHLHSCTYYLIALPAALLPATPYFLRGLFRRPGGRHDAFLLWWVLLPLGLFSLMSGKLILYLLPLFPAAAGLAGTALDRFLDGPPHAGRWCHRVAALVPLGAGVIVWMGRGDPRFTDVQGPLLAFAAACMAAGLLLAVWAFRHPRSFVWGLSAASVLLYLFPFQALLRAGLPLQTTHAIAQEYARLASAQERGCSYRDLRPSFVYHLRKPVEMITEPRRLIERLEAGDAVLVRDRVHALLPRRVREATEIVASQKLTRRKFFVIRKKI